MRWIGVTDIPPKLYFKIGEVSKIIGVKPYVLRYWESEFKTNLHKSNSKHRVYKRKDIELIQEIKRLLYEERYTIEGAKKRLKDFQREKTRQLRLELLEDKGKKVIKKIEKELKEIRDLLD